MTRSNWIDVDVDGLAKLIEGKDKVFLLHELVSNAWDTDSNLVEVELRKLPGVPQAVLVVKDRHPEGFKNLSHAYTLFAESEKKGDATKRGRFNMGEKLVLALCLEAKITSTTGTVIFDADGRRVTKERTKEGSIFEATVRMNQSEYDLAVRNFRKILPPNDANRVTVFNNEPLPARIPVTFFTATLPTVIGDSEGVPRESQRKTNVEVYEVLPGEVASIYEMGIPVVETGDKYHINVMQKVPLTMERNNVLPSFKKLVRALVVNEVHDKLSEEEAASGWVSDALESKSIAHDAVRSVITTRFGEDVVTYDPSDKESNHQAAANDFQVLHGRAFSKEAWENVREAEAVRPAGRVFPTYSGSAPSISVDEADLTDKHRRVRKLAIDLGRELCGIDITVRFFKGPKVDQAANFGDKCMGFNLSKLSPRWFDVENNLAGVVDLIIHELGHHFAHSHLDHKYHEALTRMAGRVAVLALSAPQLFR